jgi:hypothetical protein
MDIKRDQIVPSTMVDKGQIWKTCLHFLIWQALQSETRAFRVWISRERDLGCFFFFFFFIYLCCGWKLLVNKNDFQVNRKIFHEGENGLRPLRGVGNFSKLWLPSPKLQYHSPLQRNRSALPPSLACHFPTLSQP